jgi:hypothetical protein
MQFEEDQAMENPQSLERAGYRYSSSADPLMITPQFTLAFRPEDKNRGNLLFVRRADIEVEGELRHREFQPNGSDARVRTAEIHASSILTLDRAEKTEHDSWPVAESTARAVSSSPERRQRRHQRSLRPDCPQSRYDLARWR